MEWEEVLDPCLRQISAIAAANRTCVPASRQSAIHRSLATCEAPGFAKVLVVLHT